MKVFNQHVCHIKGLILLGLLTFNQSGVAGEFVASGLSHEHNHAHKKTRKASSSISMHYELSDEVIAGEKNALAFKFGSKVSEEGTFVVKYKTDQALRLTDEAEISLSFDGNEIETVVNFIAENDGLYYLKLAVMQLDEQGAKLQAGGFVVPILVGTDKYAGKVSTKQAQANKKLVDRTFDVQSTEIIEMIAK